MHDSLYKAFDYHKKRMTNSIRREIILVRVKKLISLDLRGDASASHETTSRAIGNGRGVIVHAHTHVIIFRIHRENARYAGMHRRANVAR